MSASIDAQRTALLAEYRRLTEELFARHKRKDVLDELCEECLAALKECELLMGEVAKRLLILRRNAETKP